MSNCRKRGCVFQLASTVVCILDNTIVGWEGRRPNRSQPTREKAPTTALIRRWVYLEGLANPHNVLALDHAMLKPRQFAPVKDYASALSRFSQTPALPIPTNNRSLGYGFLCPCRRLSSVLSACALDGSMALAMFPPDTSRRRWRPPVASKPHPRVYGPFSIG